MQIEGFQTQAGVVDDWTVVRYDGRLWVKGHWTKRGKTLLKNGSQGVEVPATTSVEVIAFPAQTASYWLEHHPEGR